MIVGLGNLGADPPQFLIDTVAAGIDADAQAALRQTGRNIVNRIVKIPGFAPTAPAPASAWSRLVAPLVDPLSDGAEEALAPKLAIAAAFMFGAGALAGYLVRGRRR